jgi:hypothetical protein
MIIPLPPVLPRAVKLPTRTPGLKVPVVVSAIAAACALAVADLTTWGPYSALLRVGLAIPSLLPSPWWALTPPFHHHRGSVQCKHRTPRQTLLCGAFPEVTPAGRYPAPYLHGVRTFLEAPITRTPRSPSHPRDWRHRRDREADQALYERQFFLPDLARDKSGRACLPLAGAKPRRPRQPRPDFQAFVCGTSPLARRRSAFGQYPYKRSTGAFA